MDDFSVSFALDLAQKLHDAWLLSLCDRYMPEEQAKPVKALLRALAKRGVPPQTVIEALLEAAEGGV